MKAGEQVPVPDAASISAFLHVTVADAIHLVSIVPDAPDGGAIGGRWFGSNAHDAAIWAAERNAEGANVYWTVNRVRDGLNAKPKKSDIAAARFAHVDIDPPKDGRPWERSQAIEALAELESPPSFVIDSGGGLQAFWRLEEESLNFEAIEATNRGIMARFGADACWNIDRLMRVPGTVNYPDARKRERGRVPALAGIMEQDDGTVHDPLALAHRFPAPADAPAERPKVDVPPLTTLITADDLALPAFDPLRMLIDQPAGTDRSADALRCAGEMVRAGLSDAQVMGILLNPANPVSAHCLGHRDPHYAAARCLSRARGDEERARREVEEGARLAEQMGLVAPVSGGACNTLPLEWFGDIEPRLSGLWLVKKLLPASGLALIYGHPGSGKSFLALDLAFHVALGWPWQGKRVRQGLVVYVGAEGSAGLRNRIVAFRRHHEIGSAVPVPLALVPTAIDLQAPKADTPRLIAAIRHAAAASGFAPALIVVDTLSKTFGAGKENTDDMAIYVANCAQVAQAFGCCVMPVHHRPKDAESAEPRGHGSLKGGVDTVILVENGRVKKATVTKQKDAPEGETVAFALRSISLGEDEDGEEVTSCIVEGAEAVAAVFDDPIAKAIATLPDGPRLALRQLDEVIAEHGLEPPDAIPTAEINRLFTHRVAATGTWREKAIQAAGTDRDMDRDTGKKAFNRALKVLQTRGIVRVWGDFAWRDWGGFQADRDKAGQATGTEAGHRDMPGHTPLGVSRCPGSSGAVLEHEGEA